MLFHFSSKVERRVVSVLGIVVFLTRGYKSEAIMAFWASRNRDKVKEDRKLRFFGSVCFWQLIFWQRDLVCFGYAEPFSYEDIKFVSISAFVVAVFSYFVSVSSLFVVHAFLLSFLTFSLSSFVYAHTLLILKLISV